ncbi:MAG: hypothetical protein QGH45_00580 [Myxococcota bacterium]|jgi:hypothetical protein|nr:hypothetical protein [Myxococcota bacterium]
MRPTIFLILTAGVLALAGGCTTSETQLPQDIHLADEWLVFGTVAPGATAQMTTRIHNAGDAELALDEAPVVVADFGGTYTVEADWTTIPPGSIGS